MLVSDQTIQYEDTFTQTIIINIAFVIIVLVLFGILKSLFPSVYMPLVQSKQTHWIRDIFRTPLAMYAKRGNFALFLLFSNLFL
ncbi:Putative_phosphate transporter [Hexamita inflata]|uniref:Phosphate transporter n=1 Tax=Hexamita inflata TaxID=28002 RepID=A0AA86QYR5_9EUKA|nr:Putative phosphate transporter [Hexamita inflata]